MIGVADLSLRSGLRPAPAADALTHVELTWVEKTIEFWIRFGRETAEQIVDRRRRIVSFAPDSVFAFVRWTCNDYGTTLSRLDIVRAVRVGEPCQTLPFVRPGGDILLRISGWPKVQRVLAAIDALDIDPADVAPEHWRHLNHRISVNEPFRIYSPEQHRAWLLRREVSP